MVFLLMLLLEHLYFRRLSGGLPSLDTRLAGFSTDSAYAWLTALGPAGSQAVLVWHYMTLDLVFPALFGLTLASLTLAASRNVPFLATYSLQARSMASLVWVTPYVTADYAGNILVARFLSDPTGTRPEIIDIASILVVLKFVFAAIGIIVIVAMTLIGQRLQPPGGR
jgi:hypothetical protein